MNKLLQILSDGEFHSGEELGNLLGISRAAIWKQMQKLDVLGLPLESQKGCGYRVVGGLDLLVESELIERLPVVSRGLIEKLQIESSVTSTNEIARLQAEAGDASGLVVLAEQQTAGRGRRGRQWVSPYGCNLYLSVVWAFEGGIQAIEGLSLAIGVAARRAMIRCGAEGLKLKWPNDLLWEKKKVGGILLEIIGDPTGYCQVVVGLGVNFGMPQRHATEINQDWADLSEILPEGVGRNLLAATLLDEVLSLLSSYHEVGFAHYRDDWLNSDAYANQPVRLLLVKQTIGGVARGVDGSGALELDVNGERHLFSGGEISLRGL